jgi:hypothetical protein
MPVGKAGGHWLLWLLRGAFLVGAVVLALIFWRAADEDGGEASAFTETRPRIVPAAELSDVVARVGHLVYWAGPVAGTRLAVSEGVEGIVEVRYVGGESEPARDRGQSLTVISYPTPDPATEMAALAAAPGAVVERSIEGIELVARKKNANWAYFASPEDAVRVEVFARPPKRAMALARSGQIRPAG